MNYEIVLKVIEIILQFAVIFIAWKALSVWKSEIRGKDNYELGKELLKYVEEIGFLVSSNNGSWHQIFLNDILIEKENFYNKQISLIKNEKILFDDSIWSLFSHINSRNNIFLPQNIRILLDELTPKLGKKIGEHKNQFTYIKIIGVKDTLVCFDEKDRLITKDYVYQMNSIENLTIEEYFRKWEKLVKELQKIVQL